MVDILTPAGREARFPKFSDAPYSRTVAAGTLITSAILLVSGKRKAALAAAAAGTTLALISEPGAAREVWEKIPTYVKSAQHMLDRVENLLADATEQGKRAKKLFKR